MTTSNTPPQKKRKKFALCYFGICLLLVLLGFLFWLFYLRFIEYTDDAYVEGNQVYITPLRPGFIQSIYTDDTYLVKKGQLLVELDKTDSRIALEKSQKDLANTTREVSQLFHQVFVYRAELVIKEAILIKAAQDYQHRLDVLAAAGVSLEDFQHAVAALRSAHYDYKKTETLFNQALSLVQGTSIMSHPLVRSVADRLRDAYVQLYRCDIYSPVEGLAAQRKIQVGMWVNAGNPLMSVIPLDQIWVNANFKETQLTDMRIGQKVKITSDLYGDDIVFKGIILGLPGAAGNAFSLLPPQNLSGNWIKIVQRLPVRVGLDPEELKKYPLRIGLSMEATVNLRDQRGLRVPNSTEGSPTYSTTIFREEELGDLKMVAEIIEENLDPTLMEYADRPLNVIKKELDVNLQCLVNQL
ncbi:MAG: efflux RND transporter periplasmic adaptor subunit [Chlamydiales bacterium]|nr:efflux RND transporter periplasmic adaptor subunit [Chlamydiales bacterium]